jgi:ElaB/YqjD/DUF883 family membrane-anchored ribosome-binding protein
MSDNDHRRVIDEVVRELDLLVYRLEQPLPEDGAGATFERQRLRRDLEKLRDRLDRLSEGWW